MSDQDALSRADIIKLIALRDSFPAFLDFIGFTGNHELASNLEINRGLGRSDLVMATEADCVHVWIAWLISFQIDIRPLWLVRDRKVRSPVPQIVEIIERLGKLGSKIDECNSEGLRIRQLNSGLDVQSIYPNAGRGASPTHLIIEDCSYRSPEWNEMIGNLAPALYGATKGKGSIITIEPA